MDDSSDLRYSAGSAQEPANPEPQPTVVGGRPGGKGRGSAGIPVGIQVLVKKAAVDSEFRDLLMAERSQAADRIGLELTPAENATVNSVPKAQLEKIIEHTKVPDEHRRVFLGYLGAAMVALIGLGVTGCYSPTGSRPDNPPSPASTGLRSDRPYEMAFGADSGSNTRGIKPDRSEKGDGTDRTPVKGPGMEEPPSSDKKE